MKKLYETPLTECVKSCNTYTIMAGTLTDNGDGTWKQDTNDDDESTDKDGRSNYSVWDSL